MHVFILKKELNVQLFFFFSLQMLRLLHQTAHKVVTQLKRRQLRDSAIQMKNNNTTTRKGGNILITPGLPASRRRDKNGSPWEIWGSRSKESGINEG